MGNWKFCVFLRVFPSAHGIIRISKEELESRIVDKAKLWLDSGAIFGKVGEGFERINIATQRSVLQEALTRIRQAIAEKTAEAADGGEQR